MDTKSLYIHIPFCDQICTYCDFCKVFYDPQIVDHYLEQLIEEIQSLQITETLETIYIGGGTPSSLTFIQLDYLLTNIQPYIGKQTKEVTIECNPESMTKEKLLLCKQKGVTRLSVGVQTFHEPLLQGIGRTHTNDQVFTLLRQAKEVGIPVLSIDMMYGLPKQTMEDVEYDLEILKTLSLDHLSYYSLILEEHTKLYNETFDTMSEEGEYEVTMKIEEELHKMGFDKYEVSNYARNNQQSIHNKVYWQYKNYYGVGAGASSKQGTTLINRSKNVYGYSKGNKKQDIIITDKKDTMFQHIMMSMRLVEGLDVQDFNGRYQVDFLEEYKDVIKKHQTTGLIEYENGYLRCKGNHLQVLHTVLIDFL